jgi:hypothetical protein
MRIKLNKHGLFDARWTWTELEQKNCLKALSKCDTPVLHVCSGSSSVGDILLDRVKIDYEHLTGFQEHRGHANVLGSMLDIPFKNSSFPTVLCDPPYDYKWFENGIYQGMVDEIVRVTKIGGKILFYAPSVFTHPALELIETKYSQMGQRCYFKILSTSIKKNGQIGDYV